MTDRDAPGSAPSDGAAYPAMPRPAGTTWPYAPQRTAPVGLGVASIALAIGLTVVELGTALASVPAAKDFRDAVEGGQSSYDVLTMYDGLELLLFPFMVAAYVVSCLWLQFARANALVISPGTQHKRGTVWLWLGWWVPIVSFWFPYQVVRDIQDGSRPREPALGLGLWWTAWLVYVCGNRITARAATSDDVGLIGALPVLEAITAVAVVVACVQWCRLVRRITDNQREALAHR